MKSIIQDIVQDCVCNLYNSFELSLIYKVDHEALKAGLELFFLTHDISAIPKHNGLVEYQIRPL